jgi:dephospho-CoA kinase
MTRPPQSGPTAMPDPDRTRRRPLLIGITGPIGCGKSTISAALASRGGIIVDADRMSHQASERGSALVAAIGQRFGPAVIAADGSLDRPALGRIVFSDPAALRTLEAIVQPAVRVLIERAVESADSAGAPFVVVEAIKLVEAGYAARCDEVWLVTCTPEQQRERLAGRGFPADEIERRIAAQGADLADRLRPSATRVIDASGTIAVAVRRAFEALDAAIGATASAHPASNESTAGGSPSPDS